MPGDNILDFAEISAPSSPVMKNGRLHIEHFDALKKIEKHIVRRLWLQKYRPDLLKLKRIVRKQCLNNKGYFPSDFPRDEAEEFISELNSNYFLSQTLHLSQ